MPNIKRIFLDWSETGITVYYIGRREVDNYRMDDADGNFASAPADPYQELTEDAVIKGRYEADESRVVWDDGVYTFIFYEQSGGSPVPVNDRAIGTGEMTIENDLEVYISALYALETTAQSIKTQTDKMSFIGNDVVATLDGETVAGILGAVRLDGDIIEDFTETEY